MALAGNKIALIHVAKKQLHLSDESYQDVLRLFGGVESSRDLDDTGFRRVMLHFEDCGFESTTNQKNFGYRAGMATSAQIGLVRKLWEEWSDNHDEAGLRTWLEKHHGVSDLRFLDRAAVGKVITALKRMTGRKLEKAEAAAGEQPSGPGGTPSAGPKPRRQAGGSRRQAPAPAGGAKAPAGPGSGSKSRRRAGRPAGGVETQNLTGV